DLQYITKTLSIYASELLALGISTYLLEQCGRKRKKNLKKGEKSGQLGKGKDKERIAQGKEVRNKGDYPTFNDVESDWDSAKDKDKGDKKDEKAGDAKKEDEKKDDDKKDDKKDRDDKKDDDKKDEKEEEKKEERKKIDLKPKQIKRNEKEAIF
ncbi:hypothetical protein Y032_0971g3250, partial [Ancylostoma ceylanicum]